MDNETFATSETRLNELLATLDDPAAVGLLLDDLCTPSERRALAERWHVARLLAEGKYTYRQIHDLTGVSTTTITRVARFLNGNEAGGYRLALDAMRAPEESE